MEKSTFNFTVNDIPKWAEFDWIDIEITNSIFALDNLFSLQNKSFATVKSDLDERIKKVELTNSEMNLQDLNSYKNHLFEIEESVTYEINRAQQFSQILILFSIFESKLKMICDKIQKDFGITLENQKSNSVILKHRKFLESFLENEYKEVGKLFTKIHNQYKIRNIITHQNGIANKNQYKLLMNIETINFSLFEGHYYLLIPDNNFIKELLLLIKKFFFELLKVLKLKTNVKLQQTTKS